MLPYHIVALDLYEERLREAERRRRILAAWRGARRDAPHHAPSWAAPIGRALARLLRRPIPRPA